MDLGWDAQLGASLPMARHTVSAPNPDKWRASAAAIEAVRPVWAAEHDRALALVG